MALLFTNNGQSALASGVSSSATSMVVTTGHGARFPAPSGGNTFRATLVRASDSAIEVVDVTARSTDTMTVVRGQEGTTGLTLSSGDKFELRITAAYLNANTGDETGASIAALHHAASVKTSPADDDEVGFLDSAAAWVLKKLTWANLKAGVQSGLQFLQSGTGAVARGNQDKLREFVSSADFSTLQEAANYACANAKNLHIEGNYTVSSAVTFDTDAITVTGNGPRSSIITTSSATADIFVFGNGSTLRQGITIRDIGFNTSVAKSAGVSLKLNKVNQAVIDNVWIGSPFCGISLLDSTIVRVKDVEIHNPTATTGIGWLIDGTTGNDQSLSNVFVAGNVAAQPLCGGRIRHSGGVWLDNVGTIWGGSAGLLVDPANGQSVLNVFSSRCAWDTCSGSGMLVQPTGTGAAMRWVSNGDWFATNTLHGFSTAGTSTISGFTFHAPRFFNNGRHGASIANGTGFYFTTPKAAGNSTSTSNTYDGINIAAGILNFAVSGGKSGFSDGFTNIQRYGVYIAAGASDGYSVTNVDLTGNLTSGLLDGGTGLNKVMYPNIGVGTAIVPNAVPSVDWGIDFAKRGVTVVANGTPYALASGSGLVMLHNNGTGAMGLFMAYAGTVTKVSGDATMVSGAAGANQIGLAYNAGGYYQVSNGYVANQQVYISTIKTRTAS